MQTFTDKNGKKWVIELNVGTARKVLAECNVDLINVLDFDEKKNEKNVLERLAEDPILLADVLYSLCGEQAKKENIDDFAFATLFNAQTIIEATEALMEEVINFSPPVRQKVLRKIYETGKSLMGKMEQEVEKALESPEFANILEEELQNLSTGSQE